MPGLGIASARKHVSARLHVTASHTCRSWVEQFQNLQQKMRVHRAALLNEAFFTLRVLLAHGLDMPFVHFWGLSILMCISSMFGVA